MELDMIMRQQRDFFLSGATLSVDFRLKMLKRLYAAVKQYEPDIAAALREAKEVFRRSRELISDCERSVASLAAQLARRLDPDYAPRVAPEDTTMIASDGGAGGAARDAPATSRRRKQPA